MSINICGSIFGAISISWDFSCIDDNGNLLKEKWEGYMKLFSENGANQTREVTFLLGEKEFDGHYAHMPYVFEPLQGEHGQFDLSKLNGKYFDNLRQMADIANNYGIQFLFSLCDRCHGIKREDTPYKNNINDVDTWYNEKGFAYLDTFINKVIDTLSGTDYGLELENEPFDEGFATFSGPRTLDILKKRGIEPENIILGINYATPDGNKENPLYNTFKKNFDREYFAKQEVYSVVHNISEKLLESEKLGDSQKHTRRFFWSDDGIKPKRNKDWWLENLLNFFKKVNYKKNKAFKFQWTYEHLCRGDADDWTGISGIRDAIAEYKTG